MSGPVLVTARGIGEPMDGNMLSRVVDHFPGTTHIELPWSASYGLVNRAGNLLGHSFKQALEYGDALFREVLDAHPEGVIAGGYSGGAALVGNRASYGHPNLRAVFLVADPYAPPVNGLSGLAGVRNRPINVPVLWKRDPKDVICNARKDSRLRYIADLSEAFSLGDIQGWFAEVAAGTQTDAIARLIRDRWAATLKNPFGAGKIWSDFALDISDAEGYLYRGDHTGYGVRREANGRTYLENTAIWIRQQMALLERSAT